MIRSTGDDQGHQDCQGRLKADSLPRVPGQKKQNAGMEISDYKRGCPRVISCKRSGEGTEDRNRIFKKAGTKDRDKIGDIRERTNNF